MNLYELRLLLSFHLSVLLLLEIGKEVSDDKDFLNGLLSDSIISCLTKLQVPKSFNPVENIEFHFFKRSSFVFLLHLLVLNQSN